VYDELESALKAKVESLPPTCQKIYVMSRVSYKTNNEIASELGISVQAVKNQVSKALKVLRTGLNTHTHSHTHLLK
jgi:RNA polymerase sigma factor (sigma-70 family)